MRPLSKRLQVIFDLVPDEALVADIGTDHAYLPIALSKSGKAKKIIACDIKEKPLKTAQKNIEKFNIQNIDLRLGDGVSPVKEQEVNTVIIAGMGGDVISHIISSCSWLKNSDVLLLLQPMTSAELLRTFLYKNLFEIKKEIAVSDSSKVYSVMCVGYSGVNKQYPTGSEFIGKVSSDTPDGRLYIEKQRSRIKKCINMLSSVESKQDEVKHLSEILNYIEKNQEN